METVIRVAVTYVFLMFAFRVIGKRELSKLSSFELVTLLLIPEIFSQAMVREDFSMTNAIVAVSTLFALVLATSMLTHRFGWFEKMIEAEPTLLVSDGRILTRHLDQERIQASELFAEMHKAGIERLEQVKFAILESDGRISFIRHQPEITQRPQAEDDDPA
jgi:uncharacterized membrane protein YcaP (DUF421 family)